MVIDERRQRLSEFLAVQGYASLSQLVEEFGVSEATIRRDLSLLEEKGVVRRTHGGATFIGERLSIIDYARRETTAVAEKQAIGRETVKLINDGETVLLDGGTTTFQVAKHLVNRSLQVVTNSLPIATLLNGAANIELIFIGGYIYPRTGVALGPIAQQTLGSLNVSKAIMGVAGATEDALYNANVMMVATDQQMIKSANEVIIVADANKFGKAALARMGGWEDIDYVVSDKGLEQKWQDVIRRGGAELILADVDKNNG